VKIIVPTCGKYSETWQPHIEFMRMFWPTCPYTRLLVTDAVPHPERTEGFDEVLNLGGDRGWPENLLAGLERADDRLVLMILDDFWCDEPVLADFIPWAEQFMRDHPEAGCFRLYCAPPATKNLVDERWGEIEIGTPYRICTCQGIWRVSYMRDILRQVKTAAEFEIRGTELSFLMPDPIYGTTEKLLPIRGHYSAIQRGFWMRGAVARAIHLGINVDIADRSFDDWTGRKC